MPESIEYFEYLVKKRKEYHEGVKSAKSSTVHNHSVRIIISYYSMTRLKREQILGLFELCPYQLQKTPEKFVLNSIWLIYGSTVIRLQRLQTATCKNMLVSILLNILTPLS